MFVVNVNKNIATISETEQMTSGSSKVYLVEFSFSPEWDDLTRTAVFRSGGTVIDVLLDEDNTCFIPWEVLTKSGGKLDIGVYGTKDEDIILPTIWASTNAILEGVKTGTESAPPTPTVYEKILAKLERLEEIEKKYLNKYSLEETKIGTWIDGRPIYRTVLITTSPDHVGGPWTKACDNIPGAVMIHIYGICHDPNVDQYHPIPLTLSASTSSEIFGLELIYDGDNYTRIDGPGLKLNCYRSFFLNMPVIICMEYYKTTDSPMTNSNNLQPILELSKLFLKGNDETKIVDKVREPVRISEDLLNGIGSSAKDTFKG